MKKSKLLAAALAATMFTTAACGLVACDDDSTRYVVTFNANGGTLIGDEALYTNASGIVKGALPTAEKEDGAFKGWALTAAADESAVINLAKYKFDKDKTVYAVYKDYEVVTITFEYGEGKGTRKTEQTENGKLSILPKPTTAPDGKKFDGWFTAATGGERVTVDTVFEQAATLYAQYSNEEYTNYCLVGDTKYELEENAVTGAEASYFICVDLSADDTVSFYVDGQIISASVPTGGIWLGMKPSTGKKDVFTAELAGTFEFTITLSGTTPAWKITADNGTVLAIEGDYYLVGLGAEFGNWKQCLEKWHLGTATGSVDVTVGATPATFKVAKAKNRLGEIEWSGELGIAAVVSGRGYASTDKDKNIVLKTASTYTITLEGGELTISADFPEPEPTKDIDGYTYGAVVSTKYYLVGGFIGEDFDATNGYQMIKNPDNASEYTVGGFTVEADGAVKIVFGANSYGYANINEQWGNKDLAKTDDDGNIVFKAAGTYSIFFNPTTGDIFLSWS